MYVCLSITKTPQPLRIAPINHWAYLPSSLSTIEPINHRAYQPSSLLTIKPIDHQAYQPSSLSTSGLLLRLLSLSPCCFAAPEPNVELLLVKIPHDFPTFSPYANFWFSFLFTDTDLNFHDNILHRYLICHFISLINSLTFIIIIILLKQNTY